MLQETRCIPRSWIVAARQSDAFKGELRLRAQRNLNLDLVFRHLRAQGRMVRCTECGGATDYQNTNWIRLFSSDSSDVPQFASLSMTAVPSCGSLHCLSVTRRMNQLHAGMVDNIIEETGATVPDINICTGCGAANRSLRRCGRCRSVHYCSRECQRGHWPIHRFNCSQI